MIETSPADGRPADPPPVPFVKRVRIQNYKSIARCDVELGPLTVLVGRNGSGKSNFLDALGFVADALRNSLPKAMGSRRVAGDLWRKGAGSPPRLEIGLEFTLPEGRRAAYGFVLSRGERNVIGITSERLSVDGGPGGKPASFAVEGGRVVGSSEPVMPPPPFHTLYLPVAAGLPAFRKAYEALASCEVYDFDPGAMREFQEPGAGELLRRDGSNVAGVVGRLAGESPEGLARLVGYLGAVVPGVAGVRRVELGPLEALEFETDGPGPGRRRAFYAASMSDGTLRALGALVAVAQLAEGGVPVSLVGIEEPETALHPAASAALMDALREAAVRTQVVVTTHSPDLLDQIDPETDRLLAVQMRDGNTEIGPIDRASREAIRGHLYSPGELLRMDQLEVDWDDLQRQSQPVSSGPPGGAG